MRKRRVAFSLLLCTQAACAPWPSLTLAASASFRGAEAPADRGIVVVTSATLGWPTATRPPMVREPSEGVPAPAVEPTLECTQGSLCTWERRGRETALAELGLPVEVEEENP